MPDDSVEQTRQLFEAIRAASANIDVSLVIYTCAYMASLCAGAMVGENRVIAMSVLEAGAMAGALDAKPLSAKNRQGMN